MRQEVRAILYRTREFFARRGSWCQMSYAQVKDENGSWVDVQDLGEYADDTYVQSFPYLQRYSGPMKACLIGGMSIAAGLTPEQIAHEEYESHPDVLEAIGLIEDHLGTDIPDFNDDDNRRKHQIVGVIERVLTEAGEPL